MLYAAAHMEAIDRDPDERDTQRFEETGEMPATEWSTRWPATDERGMALAPSRNREQRLVAHERGTRLLDETGRNHGSYFNSPVSVHISVIYFASRTTRSGLSSYSTPPQAITQTIFPSDVNRRRSSECHRTSFRSQQCNQSISKSNLTSR
jgi:hypothetical protein